MSQVAEWPVDPCCQQGCTIASNDDLGLEDIAHAGGEVSYFMLSSKCGGANGADTAA